MIFTRDLLSQGASEPELRRVRKTTSKVRHGVYAAEVEDDWHLFDLKCAATLRLLKPGAALAGPAAARHWGLPLVGEPPGQVHVRGITRGGYGRGVKVVNGGRPALIEHHGLQVTSVAWTVVDCARLLPRRDALMVADAALHLRMCTHEDLVQAAASLGKAKGVGRVRWIIANADPASESAGETWMRMIVKDLGYAVTSQHRVNADGHRHRIDLLLDGTLVGLEFDGLIKYDRNETEDEVAAVVREEKRRQGRIEAIGYRLLRVIWEQLFDVNELDRRIRYARGVPLTRRIRSAAPPGW